MTGRWSDAAGRRKPFVVGGYVLAAIGKAIRAVAPAWPVALVGRSVDRFGKGIRTAPRDALLADFADERYRGRVFGLHRTMDTLGAVLGPLAGLLLLLAAFDDRLRLIMVIALVPGIAAVLVLRWLPEHAAGAAAPAVAAPSGRLPGRFYVLLAITLVFMVGNSSDVFLILRSSNT